jgi:hypothetical protein
LIKRRYKSGLPLPSERNEDDLMEEAYLRQFCETNLGKVSKDDSGSFYIIFCNAIRLSYRNQNFITKNFNFLYIKKKISNFISN